MKPLRFQVFGREVLVVVSARGWLALYSGADGKTRPATDIVIPAHLRENDIEQYLDDLCHEWATDRHPRVKRLD